MQPDLARLHLHIVAGRFNKHIPELLALSEQYPGITIHQTVDIISKLMLDCDIAVSAGGSTLYELCACGTPTVVFGAADNQLEAVAAFGEGYMLGCGDWRDSEEDCLEKIMDNLLRLDGNLELRRELAVICRELVPSRKHLRL